MLCDKCGHNEATIHLTDVINSVKTERHLCRECYEAAGFAQPFGDEVIDALIGGPAADAAEITLQIFQKQIEPKRPAPPADDPACPHCGMTLSGFHERGVVGCSEDYDFFSEDVVSLIMRLHGAQQHHGKVPLTVEADLARRHQVAQLQADLERAVRNEAYEDAARLRDRIAALERPPEAADA